MNGARRSVRKFSVAPRPPPGKGRMRRTGGRKRSPQPLIVLVVLRELLAGPAAYPLERLATGLGGTDDEDPTYRLQQTVATTPELP